MLPSPSLAILLQPTSVEGRNHPFQGKFLNLRLKRRVAWSAVGGRLTHHNALSQVFADSNSSRVVWIADLLPNALAPVIAGMIEQGLSAMKKTLESSP